MLNKDSVLLSRARLRKLRELPIWVKSKTEMLEPNLVTEKTESVLARRLKERIDKLLPRCTKSNTVNELPARV
jgi:hypothetical protein